MDESMSRQEKQEYCIFPFVDEHGNETKRFKLWNERLFQG